MKRWIALLTLMVAMNWVFVGWVLAQSSHMGQGDMPGSHSEKMEHGDMTGAHSEEMEHGDMASSHSEKMEHGMTGDTFTHEQVDQGVRAEFQVMSLASMNMKDPEGNTHHIMVKFFNDGMNHQINNVVGKIKLINPSGKEQIGDLKDYNGIYAVNFTFEEKGKYGVICLFKVDGKKHLVKFWYPHG